MRKTKQSARAAKKTPKSVKGTDNSYELYRTLPNPLYESAAAVNAKKRAALMAAKIPEKQGRPAWKKALISLAVLIAVVVVGVGGYLGYKFIRDFGWGNVASLFDSTKLNGENVGRVNILLAGYSVDDPGHDGAALTDSIMLVSIDTKNNKAYLLSIPRDLYANIPGFDYSKINAAYEYGEGENFNQPGYFEGGMGLLQETVEQELDVNINYYALIDYTAFRDLVNAVGGITIDIQSPDPRGLYDPNTNLKLPNGMVTLDGQQALNLARARGDGYGSYGFPQADFDRTEHQRQMLIAVVKKASTIGVLSNPVKVGDLFDAVGKNVKTDLQLDDDRRLAQLMKKIPYSTIASESFNSATYDGQKNVDLLTGYLTPDGEDALIPTAGVNNYSQLQAYVQALDAKY